MAKIKNSWFKVVYLKGELNKIEQKNKLHPLILVFKPYIEDSERVIEKNCSSWYSDLEKSDLPDEQKDIFCTIFIHWIMERFNTKNYEEIRKMAGIKTPLEETKAYKELIEKGIEQGIEKGIVKGKTESVNKIAENMIKEGADLNFIAKVTGLSIGQIEKLKTKK